jgi:hypothetical protein
VDGAAALEPEIKIQSGRGQPQSTTLSRFPKIVLGPTGLGLRLSSAAFWTRPGTIHFNSSIDLMHIQLAHKSRQNFIIQLAHCVAQTQKNATSHGLTRGVLSWSL